MTFTRFEDIEAWKNGCMLVEAIYRLTKAGAFAEDWSLRDQIRRAAVSIPSNIAEGYARRGNKEFVKFLWISKGSAAEVQSQLHNAKALGYVSQEQFELHYNEANLIQVQLYRLIQTLTTKIDRQKL